MRSQEADFRITERQQKDRHDQHAGIGQRDRERLVEGAGRQRPLEQRHITGISDLRHDQHEQHRERRRFDTARGAARANRR